MSAPIQTSTRHFDTIITGAGISGLACAARLFQHRARLKGGNLAVLEARDRIGGRIGSVHVNGNRLDTGANWIHGIGTDEAPNPLMKVLPHKRYRSLEGSIVFRPPTDQGAIGAGDDGDSDGWEDLGASSTSRPAARPNAEAKDNVIPSESAGALMGAMWSTIGALHETATTTEPSEAKHTTMLKAITQSEPFRDAFEELDPEYHPTLRALPQFIENMEAAPLVAQSAEHAEGNPGMGLLEFAIDDFEGDQVFLQDGYTAVVDELAKNLVKEGVIELGVQVEQIDWDTDPITISTSAGKYSAGNVVCTLPLGVLKERQLQATSVAGIQRPLLFKPDLPEEKKEAISHLGFGTLDKIFLVFSHAWWTEEPYTSIFKDGIVQRPLLAETEDATTKSESKSDEPDSFVGFTPSLSGLSISPSDTTPAEPGPRVLSLINLHSLTGFPVLSAFVSCSNATYIESLSDAVASDIVYTALTQWFGREIPKSDAVHVTRWARDEFSRGSYSHMIAGLSERRHREVWKTPLRRRGGGDSGGVRFAGEHTSGNHFATAHGALLSGWREAEGILERGRGDTDQM